MIDYRLLVDLEAVVELDSLPKRSRNRLLLFFEKLRAYPEEHCTAEERDDRGRRISITSHAGWLIYYWTDFADRHVKILKVRRVSGNTTRSR
ncbi:MAG: hypothetical protein IPK22_11910 [Verrucomicrobiaceae bacterium]|nr:hypothetical protein [Verrucomicrobiaceae bacterium]